jgi:hypothetical protein
VLPTDVNGHGDTTWIAPGNGWAPEPLSVLTMPVRVIFLGSDNIRPDDYLPDLAPLDNGWPGSETALTITGGTYPRDVALQAAAVVHQGLSWTPDDVLSTAEAFAGWLAALTTDVVTPISADAINRGIIDPGQIPGYFAGGQSHG